MSGTPCQTFLAYRGGEVCGRIAAILNQGHIDRYDERRGFFGFFECVDDQEAANGLFDAVRQWFADQGIFRLRGPANPSLNYETGPADRRLRFVADVHDDLQPALLRAADRELRLPQDPGLVRLLGAHLHAAQDSPRSSRRSPSRSSSATTSSVRPLDKSRFPEDVETVPLDLQPLADEHLGLRADVAGRSAGHGGRGCGSSSCPSWPSSSRRTARWSGRRSACPTTTRGSRRSTAGCSPSASSTCCGRRTEIKKIRMISTNVLPEYQRLGLGLVLMRGIVPKVLGMGHRGGRVLLGAGIEQLSRGSLEKGGAKITKTYRIYDLDEEPPPQGWQPKTACLLRRRAERSEPVEIRPVRPRPRPATASSTFPGAIYAEDPQWVPPLLIEIKEFLDPPQASLLSARRRPTQFIACRDGVPAGGRILVSDDPRYNAGAQDQHRLLRHVRVAPTIPEMAQAP